MLLTTIENEEDREDHLPRYHHVPSQEEIIFTEKAYEKY